MVQRSLFSLLLLLPIVGHAYVGDATARVLPVDATAWAGSSVNVMANNRQPVCTFGVHQYFAYYDADQRLVLAKRRLGDDAWEVRPTRFVENVSDAHKSVSVVVDGDGVLHVAWGHHNVPLKYARGIAPGSLELGERESMTGHNESSVTYPQFFRTRSGGLLFLYRDGGSGDGRIVLNRYDPAAGEWTRMAENLLDGEGARSAYWDMTVDSAGRLHLAWNWRETPDVATNHDLHYAKSEDEGKTWVNAHGTALKLPLTESANTLVVAIPQRSNLINPPSIGTNQAGKPVIASYWSPAPGEAPRFHVAFPVEDEEDWRVVPGPAAAEPFELAGWGTKRPPWSRAALLVDWIWQEKFIHLVYRDDHEGGRLVAATLADPEDNPRWQKRFLTLDSVGALEPSFDAPIWGRMQIAYIPLQYVEQLDGNDNDAVQLRATPIGVLAWNPRWERHQATGYAPPAPPQVDLDQALDANAIAEVALAAIRWQWPNLPSEPEWRYHAQGWTHAPFYLGVLAMDDVLPSAGLAEHMRAFAEEELQWGVLPRVYDADDHCVMQAYLELYSKYHDERMIAASKARLDQILESPSTTSLDWKSPRSRDRWSWCDALFMGPMAWLRMWQVTGEERYLEFMNREWWATTERLYRPRIGLYFRDESYLDVREPNGRTVHWSRGNGWVIAGLAQVLETFPREHPDYPRYETLFRQMCRTFLRTQQPDGLWRPGLLDPETHAARETSGSAFITYGLAWGVRHDLLDRESTLPAVRRAWNALTDCVSPEGKLEFVQPIGVAPEGFDPGHNEPFATGAFLLAASEVYQLAE